MGKRKSKFGQGLVRQFQASLTKLSALLQVVVQFRGWIVAAELNDKQPLALSWKEK